jgi:sigma-B regulation protein RsbU (phosphoserine phosphatase)
MRTRSTIAILIDYLSGDYQFGLLDAAELAARETDSNLLVVVGRSLAAPNPVEATQNDIYQRLGPECADGVIIGSGCVGIYVGPEGLTDFCECFASLPRCSVSAHLPGVPSLVISNHRGQKVVVRHMIESHGCRRIAYIR